MKRGSKPDPNSRTRRVLEALSQSGDMPVPQYQKLLRSMCDSSTQMRNLNANLQKRGFVERVVRVKGAAVSEKHIQTSDSLA